MAFQNGIDYFDLATAESASFPLFGTAFAGVRDQVYYQVHFGANYGPGKSYSWPLAADEAPLWKTAENAEDAR